MHLFETKNQYFDGLFDNPNLMWLGQNTNHFDPHPAVVEAMIDSIEPRSITRTRRRSASRSCAG